MNIDEKLDCNMMNINDLHNSSPAIQVMAIRGGLAAIEANHLATDCGIARVAMANLLNLTQRKFQHQISRNLRLDSVASERLLRLSRVVDHASAIFGSTISAGGWLMSSHSALNQATPLSVLDTAYGEQEVERILCSIEYGLPV